MIVVSDMAIPRLAAVVLGAPQSVQPASDGASIQLTMWARE